MIDTYRALCAELARVLAEEYGVEREFTSGEPLVGTGAIELLARVRTALAQPTPPDIRFVMASILLGRCEPLAPHHIAALREYLNNLPDFELITALQTGKFPAPTTDTP